MEKSTKFNLNTRTRILVYAAAAVIFIFLSEKFFFSNLGARIKNIDRQIKLKEVELKSGVSIQNKKEDIMTDFQTFKGYLNENSMSDADLEAGFLKEMEKIAQKSKVSIVSLTPGDKKSGIGGNEVFYADARIEATLDQFYSFLYEIQSSKLLIKIERMSISVKDENASALRADATISMTVL